MHVHEAPYAGLRAFILSGVRIPWIQGLSCRWHSSIEQYLHQISIEHGPDIQRKLRHWTRNLAGQAAMSRGAPSSTSDIPTSVDTKNSLAYG